MKRQPWATFLDNKELDALSHKQLQGACKKARLGASGAAATLRARLQEFVELESPPAWYTESIEAAELKKKAQQAHAQARNDALVSVYYLLEFKENEMTVGQKLVHVSVNSYCTASDTCRRDSVTLLKAQPNGCVKQKTTKLPSFDRSGWRVPGGDKTCFQVVGPGEAVFLYESHDACGRSKKERIRVTLRES